MEGKKPVNEVIENIGDELATLKEQFRILGASHLSRDSLTECKIAVEHMAAHKYDASIDAAKTVIDLTGDIDTTKWNRAIEAFANSAFEVHNLRVLLKRIESALEETQ